MADEEKKTCVCNGKPVAECECDDKCEKCDCKKPEAGAEAEEVK